MPSPVSRKVNQYSRTHRKKKTMKVLWTKATVSAVTAIVAVLFALTLTPPVQAQYSNPWAYNNNAYFNRAMAYQKAGALRKKSRRSHRVHVSKTAKKTMHHSVKRGNTPTQKAKQSKKPTHFMGRLFNFAPFPAAVQTRLRLVPVPKSLRYHPKCARCHQEF